MYFTSKSAGGKANDLKIEFSDNKNSTKRLNAYAEKFKKIKGAKTKGGNN